MKPVGYLVNCPSGMSGEKGVFYDYILAANGLFIEAQNPLIAARVTVAECEVRGLAPLENKLILTYGSIPQRFWDLALDTFMADPTKEHYVAVTGVAGYHFYIPVQDRNDGSVAYEVGDHVVLDLHSHGIMGAFFSPKDNTDETGLKLYVVVGNLHENPAVKLRVGVYGYFRTLCWKDVFDGSLVGAVEVQEEEVIDESGVCSEPKPHAAGLEDIGRWLRWDRWFRC